jgi:hypothetical protein
MRSTTDHVHEGRGQTAPSPIDEQVPDGTMDAPRETEASFEEIERRPIRERRARCCTP